MDRRRFNWLTVSCLAVPGLAFHATSAAVSLADVTNTQASQGLKAALEQGARAAVASLGQPGGFLGNDKVRISLPGYLEEAAGLLRTFGQGKRLDELVTAMNQAAEAAVPLAKDMLVNAVKTMNVQDAKNILSGGDTSVTQFFADKTRAPLGVKFLPVVKKTTAQVNLADKYNQIASKAAGMGLIKGEEVSVERYVTSKALDGLYFMIGEEEKKIRQDPVGSGSALLQKVFGALK
ncbi:DUF4197 domain-containing protein [Rhodoferax sp. U2-2l]|uniref:DUF4197 domain-containing protein n=1 Tax=Rhodoferax sp. U2-2l TaxID=2884000 RepID=UPI001D0B3792|nr:DUF4197 domain-containing protein [Rhodoferax sp. U2-2l]MCB8748808.1 DUF4197 domain-containing protein [Rhodoferax sp. U2-2l]